MVDILDDISGQSSTELILLFSGMLIIVLISMQIYQSYITNLSSEIKNNEVNDLINKTHKINNYINNS